MALSTAGLFVTEKNYVDRVEKTVLASKNWHNWKVPIAYMFL